MGNSFSRHVAKIDPSKRAASQATSRTEIDDPGNPAIKEWAAAGLDAPDLDAMRAYRLGRLRAELKARDVAGCLLYDPLNIRYATDSMNMQLWTMHNPVRYCFIATEGPVILFDFHGCEHLTNHLTLIDEVRHAVAWFHFETGQHSERNAKWWADELADLVTQYGGGNKRLLVDKCDKWGIDYLQARGVEVLPGQEFTEEARKIKSAEEMKAMRRAVHTSETGMWQMWHALQPGLTENQLWAELHHANIARGGEWIETRLLASGPRTNPWMHESSDRVIERGDIVGFDTDLIGPYGYCSDISRTWVCAAVPDETQAALHAQAMEQIEFNTDLLKPGMTFFDFADKAYFLPEQYRANRYSVVLHGVGLCDEYPAVRYGEDRESSGYDGVFEPGMVVCIESYVGAEGGHEGVKLERQALITETGLDVLDVFPMGLIPE